MKIVFTGGGTGGHIYPIVAIAREIKKIDKNVSLFYISPKTDFGLDDLRKTGVKIKTIRAGKIRNHLTLKNILQNIADIVFNIPAGIISSFFLLKNIKPDLIFSKGGFGSFPVLCANRLFKYPLYIHESDSVPGKVTKMFQKDAKRIFTSFPGIPGTIVGAPIRKEMLDAVKQKGREIFDLTQEKPVVLILGGSQGAEKINDLVLGAIKQLLDDFELIHQCGKKNFKSTELVYKTIIEDDSLDKYYHLHDYLDEHQIKHAMAAADIIVSRAGAQTIFEIAAMGKPSILIPLPKSAQDHQAKNAYLYGQTGAANVMEPKNPTPHMLYSRLVQIFSKPETLKQMQAAALKFARPKAGEEIAHILVKP